VKSYDQNHYALIIIKEHTMNTFLSQQKQVGYLPLILLVLAFVFAIGMSSTMFATIQFITIASLLWCKVYYFHPGNRSDYCIVNIYFFWMLIGVIRGIFIVETYFDFTIFLQSSISLSLPLFVYVFNIPEISRRVLYLWLKIAIPAFLLFFGWKIVVDVWHLYLGPVFLLGSIFPILPKKWKVLFLILLVVMTVGDLGARSQIVKAVVVLLIGMAYYVIKHSALLKKIAVFPMQLSHWFFYTGAIVLLYLGITGVFNPFETTSTKYQGKYIEIHDDGPEDLSADTRTFIYEEVISSAVRHNYIWQGRTPARGNDSELFGLTFFENFKGGRLERSANEVCHTNVFTWLGLIGVSLYSLIYLKSSYLALYKSNNTWIKLLGVLIAFRWAWGWLEDVNNIDNANMALWMMIAMGFSDQFRAMTDKEIEAWVLSIFPKNIILNKLI